MTLDFRSWSGQVRHLHAALEELAPAAAEIGIASPQGHEWYELLNRKLVPQAESPPLLVVALVGGTNIGKSLIFNHLAGEMASAVSPLAAGTKHPVCLAPSESADAALLEALFAGFDLRRWQSAEDPLVDSPQHRLFWREGPTLPARLLLLDTPDIDSDVHVNWQRAEAIRQVSDVLVSVLTQQKYNDAAVKQFFRRGVEADKPIVIVFNQCDLELDREYWPLWLDTFCGETGAKPEMVYVVPHDRRLAAELRLPFFSVGPNGREPSEIPSSLRDDLASLHFDRMKLRACRGALERIVDPRDGVAAYLADIQETSGEFAAAATALSSAQVSQVAWPMLPPAILVEEIRHWWDESRAGWSRNIHAVYRRIGQGATWPVRAAWSMINGPAEDPVASFHARERQATVDAVGRLLDELDRLASVGNEILRPRLAQLLAGGARAQLLAAVEQAHSTLPAVDDAYREYLRSELDDWSRQNPRAVSFMRSLDHVAALARPVITVTLALSGFALAGDLVGQTALHVASHTATELAIAGGITGGGEAVMSATGEGVKQAAARLFRRLQLGYAERRAAWLVDWLGRNVLGDLMTELRRGGEIASTPALRRVRDALAELRHVAQT